MTDVSKKKLEQSPKHNGHKAYHKNATDLFKENMQISQLVPRQNFEPNYINKPSGSPDKNSPDGHSPNGLSPELVGNVLNLSGDMLNTVYLNKKYPVCREVVCLKEGALPGENVPKTAYEKLMVPGIFIKQKVEIFEVLAGCEMENKYKLYTCDYEGNQVGASLFEAREKSNVCARWCLSYVILGFLN